MSVTCCPPAQMRAWIVTCPDDPELGAQLVYAFTANQARSLGSIPRDVGYAETVAARSQPHDARAAASQLPRVEHDGAVLREIGWREDGEQSCSTCGLYACGLSEFVVCEGCDQCAVCGCDCSALDEAAE